MPGRWSICLAALHALLVPSFVRGLPPCSASVWIEDDGADLSFLQLHASSRRTRDQEQEEEKYEGGQHSEGSTFKKGVGYLESNKLHGSFPDLEDYDVTSRCQHGQEKGQCDCYDGPRTFHRPDRPAIYNPKAMWRPSPLQTVFNSISQHHGNLEYLLWDAHQMLPAAAYNPAVAKLPMKLARSLHEDAHYLVAVRHSNSTCGRASTPIPWKGSPLASAVVMDKNFKTLVVGTLPLALEDYRLFVLDGKVLLSGNDLDAHNDNNHERWRYRVYELNLEPDVRPHAGQCPTMLRVQMKKFVYNGVGDIDAAKPSYHFYGKNLGLFRPKGEGELHILWRLSNPVDVRLWTNRTTQLTHTDPHAMRNNGNPLFLPEHNAYLSFGHQYWHGADGYVKNYVHRIVIFNADPPYNWLRASQPFCFPAISAVTAALEPQDARFWCEGVQFIMSWIRNGSDIIITYGINDCEPAIARVPLQAILDATSTDFESTFLPQDLSPPQAGGTWSFNER